MRSRLVSLFVVMFPIFAFCQTAPSIDFITGIEYSYRFLKSTEPNVINIPDIVEIRKDETGKLNWRAGFNYNQPLANNLYLKTGLRLASIGYKGENNTDIQWPSENSGGTWVPDPSLPREVQLIWDYLFLEVPIAARWEMGAKKLTPFIELGVAPTLLLTTRTTTKTDLGRETQFGSNESSNFNRVHLTSIAAFGFNYAINDHLQLFGQPTMRYHITNLSKSSIQEHLFNYGIELGLRKKLGGKGAEK